MCHRKTRRPHHRAMREHLFKTDIPVEQHRKRAIVFSGAVIIPDGQMPERRHVRDKERCWAHIKPNLGLTLMLRPVIHNV